MLVFFSMSLGVPRGVPNIDGHLAGQDVWAVDGVHVPASSWHHPLHIPLAHHRAPEAGSPRCVPIPYSTGLFPSQF